MTEAEPQVQTTGTPAEGTMDVGDREPLGRPGLHHWSQSTITQPGLDERGSVFFAAIEMTRMPMVLTDPNQDDNPIVFANNAFLDLTGYEVEEIVGRNCRFLQGALTDRDAVRQIREAIDNKSPISIEIVNYRRDGTTFWNAVFIGPVYDPGGKLLYFFASQLDVTRRRESEQSYRQAQKMESIGQLTAGLAHDFNNMLQVITGSLDRISEKRNDRAVVDRYLGAASVAADRGAKLTRQLLAFARRSRLAPKSVDLTELVGDIAELLDTTVTSKVALQLNLRRRLQPVMLDPMHLEMSLINILVNARDASSEGGLVTIETRDVEIPGVDGKAPTPGVLLAVTDQGSGMPDYVKVRATEPFFTTKGPGQGTGLGLAMAQGFVQQTGGRLEIDSREGHGTTIRMLFPVAATGERDDAEPRFAPREVDVGHAPLILVVDDMADVATLAAETLTDIGYHAVVAHSAEAGLDELARAEGGSGYALVFTDVMMPGGMNGIAFAAEIKRKYPSVPVLLTTGYNDEMVLHGPSTEGLDVLGKPYRRSELIDRVQSSLRRGARTGPGRERSDFGVAEA